MRVRGQGWVSGYFEACGYARVMVHLSMPRLITAASQPPDLLRGRRTPPPLLLLLLLLPAPAPAVCVFLVARLGPPRGEEEDDGTCRGPANVNTREGTDGTGGRVRGAARWR